MLRISQHCVLNTYHWTPNLILKCIPTDKKKNSTQEGIVRSQLTSKALLGLPYEKFYIKINILINLSNIFCNI